MKDLGDIVQLSVDYLFMVTPGSNQFIYAWSVDSRKIAMNDKRFKNSDTDTLEIDCFESEYIGTYKCTISTRNQPTVSMSAETELDIQGK